MASLPNLVGDGERGTFELLVRPAHRLAIRRGIAQHGEADAGQLVGQGAGLLVVIGPALNRQRPGPQAVQFSICLSGDIGRAQYRAGAMGHLRAEDLAKKMG